MSKKNNYKRKANKRSTDDSGLNEQISSDNNAYNQYIKEHNAPINAPDNLMPNILNRQQFANYVSNIPIPKEDPDSVANNAGALLRYHRLRLGYTQQEIASYIKSRAVTINEIEENKLLQQTSINFASNIIHKYASCLHLDPEKVVALYHKNVMEVVTISYQEEANLNYDKKMNRNWLLIILIILLAIGGYFVFSKDKNEAPEANHVFIEHKQDSGEIFIEENNNSQNSSVSGSLSINGDTLVEDKNTESEVASLDELESTKGTQVPEVLVVDENTAKAAAQEHALKASAKSKEQENAQQVKTQNSSPDKLELKQDTQNNSHLVTINAENKAKEQINTPASSIVIKAENNKSNESEIKASESKVGKSNTSESSEQKVELSSKLKDVSNKVKIIERDNSDFASLNNVKLSIHDKVYVKLIDDTKRVIISKLYQKGDSINVNGIPPFKVQVSDASAITIHYGGGKVSVPKEKQIEFKLPLN